MSADVTSATAPDTTPIHRLIGKTRSLLRSSWIATGLGLSIGLALATLLAMTLLDLLVPLWPALRLTALLLIVVPAAWVFFVGVVRPLFRRLAPSTVARRIELPVPGMPNRSRSCVDFSPHGRQRPH